MNIVRIKDDKASSVVHRMPTGDRPLNWIEHTACLVPVYERGYRRTSKPVTCKNCLRKLRGVAQPKKGKSWGE